MRSMKLNSILNDLKIIGVSLGLSLFYSCKHNLDIPKIYHKSESEHYLTLELLENKKFTFTSIHTPSCMVFHAPPDSIDLTSYKPKVDTVFGDFELLNNELNLYPSQDLLEIPIFESNRNFRVVNIDSTTILYKSKIHWDTSTNQNAFMRIVNLVNKYPNQIIDLKDEFHDLKKQSKTKINSVKNLVTKDKLINILDEPFKNLAEKKITFKRIDDAYRKNGKHQITLDKGQEDGIIEGLILHTPIKYKSRYNPEDLYCTAIVTSVSRKKCQADLRIRRMQDFEKVSLITNLSNHKYENID